MGIASESARRAVEAEAAQILDALKAGLQKGGSLDSLQAAAWSELREVLQALLNAHALVNAISG